MQDIESDMRWVYERAASVNYLIADLQTSNPKVAEELIQIMTKAREKAESEGSTAASFIGHQAVMDHVKEHHPELLPRLTGGNPKNETIH